MQSVTQRAIGVLTMAVALAAIDGGSSAAAAAERGAAKPAPTIAKEFEASTATTLTLTRSQAREVTVRGRSPRLAFDKRVKRDGSFRFEMTSGRDRVTLEVAPGAITVKRGKEVVRLETGARKAATTEPVDLRRVLEGSAAVQEFGRLSDALLATGRRSALAHSVVVSQVWIEGLIGQRVTLGRWRDTMLRQGAEVVRTSASGEEGGSCWSKYTDELVSAADERDECNEDPFLGFKLPWGMSLCDMYWFGRVESALAEYIGCLPLLL